MDVKIHILFPAVIIFSFTIDKQIQFITALLCITLHEAAHTLAAVFFNVKIYGLKILPIGLNIQMREIDLLFFQKIIVYCAGPVINLLLAFLISLFQRLADYYGSYWDFAVIVNIGLAVFNLLPVMPLDGGKIISEILVLKYGFFSARRKAVIISSVLCIMCIIAGIFIVFNSKYNFSLIIIGIYIAFSLRIGQMEAAIMNVNAIIRRREKIEKRGIYQVRHLAVKENIQMTDVIKNMDLDRFHFIYVLDNNMNLIYTINEIEIIDGILKYGSGLTFKEFMKITEKDGSAVNNE